MEKLLRRFTAKTDRGEIHEIFEYQDFVTTRTRGGSDETPGLKRYALSNGETVNHIEKGVYEMLSPFGNVRLTSDDSSAT